MSDDPGVMGNLPRSRPGRRSEKRAGSGGAKAPGGASRSGSASGAPKASASRAGGAKSGPAGGRVKAGASRGGSAGGRAKSGSAGRAKAGSAQARTGARAGARTRAPRTAVSRERVEERQGQDPITVALRAGMAVGDVGVKVLSKIVQRLPRP